MGKAFLALITTFLAGLLGMVIGFEFLQGFPELGSVVAISVMGAFIIYFTDKTR
ncbi:MAG: binding-protein-dependent transport permease [Clostridiales bacterium]|nr:binding-protein-dependent transport permease [Clostridiales bacterium]